MLKKTRWILMWLFFLVGQPLIQAGPAPFPIVAATDGCLLGGVQGTAWISLQEMLPKIKGGESYQMFSLGGRVGIARGGKTLSEEPPCESNQYISFSPSSNKDAAIALGASWNAQPRGFKSLSVKQKAYEEALGQILTKHGLPKTKRQLSQVIRIDLEGDGIEEVLVSANYIYKDIIPAAGGAVLTPRSRHGDYSVIFLRRLVKGNVVTKILSEEYYTHPGFKSTAPSENVISAIVDLNHDGVLDVVVSGHYYEGYWTAVYDLKQDNMKPVLSCGCGA